MANKAPVLRIINRVVGEHHRHKPTAIRREQEPVIASVSSDCGQIDERMDEDEEEDEEEAEESGQNSTSNLLKSSPSDSLNQPLYQQAPSTLGRQRFTPLKQS